MTGRNRRRNTTPSFEIWLILLSVSVPFPYTSFPFCISTPLRSGLSLIKAVQQVFLRWLLQKLCHLLLRLEQTLNELSKVQNFARCYSIRQLEAVIFSRQPGFNMLYWELQFHKKKCLKFHVNLNDHIWS